MYSTCTSSLLSLLYGNDAVIVFFEQKSTLPLISYASTFDIKLVFLPAEVAKDAKEEFLQDGIFQRLRAFLMPSCFFCFIVVLFVLRKV